MKKVFTFAITLLILVWAAWYALFKTDYFQLQSPSGEPVAPTLAASAAVAADAAIPDVPTEPALPLGKEYKNAKYRFSLMMPEGFRAEQLPPDDEGRDTILLQNAKGDGVQILITRDDTNQTVLTADDVRGSIPDMRVQAEQSVEIGPENRGVAFKSDNEAFQGNSREVWFYFRGNLYQISTYARLDPLLKSMFGTWKFF